MISFTWKYSIFQVIQIFIIICYFLQFLFCIGFGYNDVTINILQYELLLIFLWSLFSAIHESGTFNLYVLFLYMRKDGIFLQMKKRMEQVLQIVCSLRLTNNCLVILQSVYICKQAKEFMKQVKTFGSKLISWMYKPSAYRIKVRLFICK